MLKVWSQVWLGAAVLACPTVCAAESLYDAMALAYQTNPALRAQRADLRATDESYVQARAGYGPQVGVTAQVGYQDARVQQPASFFSRATSTNYRAGTGTADLSAAQPLYTAGAVRAQVRAAEADVSAGRESLREAEGELLQKVVTAYEDVRRDRETVRILKDEIVALTRDYDETKAKGVAGELSKTDVAQAEARLLSAQAQLNIAAGRLDSSDAAYLSVVGQNPGELEPEPELAGLPADADAAFEAAEHNNPQLLGAVAGERSAREKVTQAKAADGPIVQLKLDAQIMPNEPYLQRQYDQNVTAAVVVTQPLFTSGLNASRIRQALEEDNRAQLNIEATRRGVVQLVAQAWNQLVSTRKALIIEQSQARAEGLAAQGNRVEERAGLRSTIDLLNAELELTNTQLGLVQGRHDEYVARAALLASMGLLEVRYQIPSAARYAPEAAFTRVSGLGAPPWVAGPATLDRIGASKPPPPRVSPPEAGAERPADLPPSPPSVP